MIGRFAILLLIFIPMVARGDILPLDDALRATYTACVGIDNELSDLKKMAGINTAVTAVGTATGAGATIVGIVKSAKDKQADELERLIAELREAEAGQPNPTQEDLTAFWADFNSSYGDAIKNLDTAQTKLDNLNKQSKRLGNWRTGLIAGSTATNVAGAIIAANNKADKDLQTQIDECKLAVNTLRNSMIQARINGDDVSEAQEIITACAEYNYVDVSKINSHAQGAMISSVVGATTGAAGTITSAMANTNQVRNNNSDTGKQKEKNLNTAANILSGATTVASATATAFNATQISAIKKIASVAEKCTGVLK